MRSQTVRFLALILAIAAVHSPAFSHPGHGHGPLDRVWRDVEGRFEFEARFIQQKENRVHLLTHDGKHVWLSEDDLSPTDREWVRTTQEAINLVNGWVSHTEPADVNNREPSVLTLAWIPVIAGIVFALRPSRRIPTFVLVACGSALSFVPAGCGGQSGKPLAKQHPQPKHDSESIRPLFESYKKDGVSFRVDDTYFYVESNAFPSHPLMKGIKSWQQQVPLPQPYAGDNAWRFPLQPAVSDKPISAKKALFRGAIALAVNGVPIFNALNNRGDDTFLAGELDEFGGHCGRGDDYHYHIAPIHLEKVVGKGKPIAYALDGFPLYGFQDEAGNTPNDLDEFNGRFEKDGRYRYYSTKTYPYINGGMRGVVSVRGDQIDPQPRDAPVRPAGEPLRGATITDFERDETKKTYTLRYTLRDRAASITYTLKSDREFSFVYRGVDGKERIETYERRKRR